jgi:tetratricopeptide (TPR) repeat protein
MARFYPRDTAPWSGLGWLQLRRGNYAHAINHFKRQLCLEPQSPQAKFNFGWAMLESGEQHIAEQIFSETLAHNEDFMPARIGLANLLLDRGEYQAAMGWINKALKQQPDSRDLWFYKGMAHTGLGQLDEAELCWNHCQ